MSEVTIGAVSTPSDHDLEKTKFQGLFFSNLDICYHIDVIPITLGFPAHQDRAFFCVLSN